MGDRVIVYGGRDYNDRDAAFAFLDSVAERRAILEIIQGDCPTGADKWARMWAVCNNHHLCCFPADWQAHGKAAGPIRNQQMIDERKPTLAVEFPGGRGTADMSRRLQRAGVPILSPTPAPIEGCSL